MEEIKIKCSICGKLHMEIEVDASAKYKFKCKRCKRWNFGNIIINTEGGQCQKVIKNL